MASSSIVSDAFSLYAPLVPIDLQMAIAYRADLQILICKLCGEGLCKKNIVNHYVNKHRLLTAGLQSGQRVDLLSGIVMFCNTLLLPDEQELPIFEHWQPPQLHLPIVTGFLCRYCQFCSFSVQAMHEHVHLNHPPNELPELPVLNSDFPPHLEMLARMGCWLTSGFMLVPMQSWTKGAGHGLWTP
jgi:hypothetical protein